MLEAQGLMTQRDFDPGYHREWDGPAVLLPLTAFDGGLEARGAIAMSQKTDAIANTIGIDTGKNTLHLIGLDHEGETTPGLSRHGGGSI